MPHEINWEGRILNLRFHDDVRVDEVWKVISDVQGHPNFDDIKFSIIDFSDTTQLHLPEESIEEFAATTHGAVITNPSAIALFVTKNVDIKKILELFSEQSPRKTKFFDNLEEARSWANEQMK